MNDHQSRAPLTAGVHRPLGGLGGNQDFLLCQSISTSEFYRNRTINSKSPTTRKVVEKKHPGEWSKEYAYQIW